MKPPKPETTSILIPSMGIRKNTKHVYVTTRPCTVEVRTQESEPGRIEPAWEHIFRCVKTGVTRRFGVENRVVTN